tara:strand:- start:901 stop:1107 length:207 start_codon:yes stop_codon:yes gene_type:complete
MRGVLFALSDDINRELGDLGHVLALLIQLELAAKLTKLHLELRKRARWQYFPSVLKICEVFHDVLIPI